MLRSLLSGTSFVRRILRVMRDTTQTFGSDDSPWNNYTLRLRFTTAGLAAVQGAKYLRITVAGAGGAGIIISKMYVGLEGGTNYSFTGAQVAVTWAGSASVTVAAGNNKVVSDLIPVAIDGSAPIVLSFYFANNVSLNQLSRKSANNSSSAYKLGDDAATTSPTGYTTGAALQDMPIKIEAIA